MPTTGDAMTLTYEQNRQLREWADQLKIPPECPICGSGDMKWQGNLGPNPLVHFPGFVWRSCQTCAHVMLFDRSVIGI